MKNTVSYYDVIIVGAGPAGLSFAVSLARSDMRVVVVEKEAEAILRAPPVDGREIAHTHSSMAMLKKLEILARIESAQIAPIHEAKVLDGSSQSYFLNFTPARVKRDALGFIIPNHLIRKAAYEEAKTHKNITLMAGVEVKSLATNDVCASVTLADGVRLEAPLVVAADGRFSPCRKRMGIPVSMRDFGRSVIVCRFTHDKPHDGIAYECFNYERTLAMLPLPNNMASAVITLAADEVEKVMAMDATDFAQDVAARFDHRLGDMALVGERHLYPLVAVYAERFIANRFALLGDAAVGMHPVTAHGFNFGLKGQNILTQNIVKAMQVGIDIGSATVLDDYHRRHRAATLPLYLGTNALVKLYTSESPRAKLLRRVGLHLGNTVPPVKKFVTRYLADAARG